MEWDHLHLLLESRGRRLEALAAWLSSRKKRLLVACSWIDDADWLIDWLIRQYDGWWWWCLLYSIESSCSSCNSKQTSLRTCLLSLLCMYVGGMYVVRKTLDDDYIIDIINSTFPPTSYHPHSIINALDNARAIMHDQYATKSRHDVWEW